VPAVRVAIVDVVSAVAERLETNDHGWLKIRLIRNKEEHERDKCQAESHETLPRSARNSLGNLPHEHSRRVQWDN